MRLPLAGPDRIPESDTSLRPFAASYAAGTSSLRTANEAVLILSSLSKNLILILTEPSSGAALESLTWTSIPLIGTMPLLSSGLIPFSKAEILLMRPLVSDTVLRGSLPMAPGPVRETSTSAASNASPFIDATKLYEMPSSGSSDVLPCSAASMTWPIDSSTLPHSAPRSAPSFRTGYMNCTT